MFGVGCTINLIFFIARKDAEGKSAKKKYKSEKIKKSQKNIFCHKKNYSFSNRSNSSNTSR
jgi:hypothetical protein